MQRTFALKYIPPAILAFSLSAVYVNSMAPGLTWSNYGADGGDLITAAATNGVAHPSGYPVYLLLARVFQMLPIGTLAFRTNLMSAFAAVCAALLVYALVDMSLLHFNGSRNWLASLASAYAFGLSPLFWSQAVITEVYTLHALFTAAILFLSADHVSFHFSRKYQDALLGLIFGLAMGNHITTILLFPVLLFSLVEYKPVTTKPIYSPANRQVDVHAISRRLLWLCVGLLAYIILPLRAMSKPPVNWGNPINPINFWQLVSGNLYQDRLFGLTFSTLVGQIRPAADFLLDQFGLVGLVIGLIGLIVFSKSFRMYQNTLWTFAAYTLFALIYFSKDSFLYLIPAFLCFAVWIGIGLAGLMNQAARFSKLRLAIGVLFILYISLLAGKHWPGVDASHDTRAEDFGKEVLAKIPANAIVFAKGDEAVLALWYFHYALHQRPDIVLVAPELLQNVWYQDTLRNNYPGLNLPDDFFMFAEVVAASNPERITCYVEYHLLTQITCPK